MVLKYGTAVVKAEAEEAEAMVRVPKEEEALAWRQIPEADSEVMAVSADGVMVHLLDEGWKEVKVMSVSAVPVCEEGDKAKGELRWRSTPTAQAYGTPRPSPTTTGPKVIAVA